MFPRQGFIIYLVSGLILLISGTVSAVLSIRRVSGVYIEKKVYFYWSFHTTQPISNIPQGPIVPPPIITTIEVLLPWLIIGLVLASVGLFLLYKSFRHYRRMVIEGA